MILECIKKCIFTRYVFLWK